MSKCVCANCRHFLDYGDVDPKEPTGYCSHPVHLTRLSPHHEYGGHWTASYNVCSGWEPNSPQERPE